MSGELKIMLVIIAFYSVKARPHEKSKILTYESNLRQDGYDFRYKTSDGTQREEQAVYNSINEENVNLKVYGAFSHTFPDGTPFAVTFVADEKGYRPIIVMGTTTTTTSGPPIEAEISSSVIASLTGGGLGK